MDLLSNPVVSHGLASLATLAVVALGLKLKGPPPPKADRLRK